MGVSRSRLENVERRLDELEETMEILSDKRLWRSIERGLRDLRKGHYKKYASIDALFKNVERSP